MEVISLGLLALASGGLLAKVRADKARAKKKEGFTTTQDSLFGTVAQNTLPQDHKDFVVKSDSLFNPFASLLNFNKTNVEFTSSNQAENWVYTAPDNTTSANLFRSVFAKATPNGYAIDDNLGEKKATVYRVPTTTDIGNVIDKCQNAPVKTNDDLVADCSIFESNSEFNNICGICHGGVPRSSASNVCSNSVGKPVSTPSGLFVAARMKADPGQQQLQMDALASGGNLINMLITPTLGSCSIDPATNKNLFSIDSNSCVTNNNYLKCAVRQGFGESKNCYACSTDGLFYFVDDSNGNFSGRQPTIFTIGGNGTVSLQLLDTDGTTSLGYLSMPTSGSLLNLTSTASIFTLQATSNGMTPWKIGLTSNGESAAGKYLSISLRGTSSVPYVQGVFQGTLRSNSTVQYTDFAVTAIDITSSNNITSNVFYESGNYGMKLEPPVVNGMQGLTASFKVLIPYLYINTSNIEANYCSGPYIVNANSTNLLSNSPCYASGSMPGNYNLACLQRSFISGGCTEQGSGYPSNSNKANDLMRRARERVGSNANQGQIANYVYSEYRRSWSGLDSNGVQLTASNWTASQKFCTNSNITFQNPCENLPTYVKENGPLSDECINYIYTSGYYSDSNNGSYLTYNSNPNAASLFGDINNVPTGIMRQIEPFIGSSKKDRFCTEFGSLSPLQGGSNMAAAKNMGGIAALKGFYNNIHMKANQRDMTNAERAQYVAQCYGTTLNVEADANPTVLLYNGSNNVQTSATNCGTAGLTSVNRTSAQDQGSFVGNGPIGNIRAVRIYGNGTEYLQISQLVVLDSRGQNLALKKNISYNSVWDGSVPDAPVDGTLSIRTVPNIYHSAGTGPNEYFEVDLGGLYDIVQIIYFNRAEVQSRATGTRIYLYNNDTFLSNTVRSTTNAKYVSAPLTSAPVQYINLANPNGDASCPSILSGQRGDLLAGQTTNNGIRNNVGTLTTDLTPYPIYNLSLSSDMSLSLGGDSISGTTTAKWIWNHPYAKQGARGETVGFYTNIYNSTNIQQNYYLYYRCDDSVTAIIFNGASLPSVPSGLYTSDNPIGSKILLVALPGQNLVQVVCNNVVGRACFIAAIYDGGSWISPTDASQINYYSATNAASTASGGYSWRSYTAPNIGTIFSDSGTSQTMYEITNLPEYADGYHPSAKWIWNQPDAGQYANKPETVHFYFYINVSGTAIVNYKVYIDSDGGPNATTPNSLVSINTSNMGGLIGHANYTGAMDSQTFAVVPGRNLLQVDVTTSGAAGPAGFKAYITDNNDAVVTGSETSATSQWICTTATQWSLENACVYVPSGGITYNCAAKIWGSNCSQGFSDTIYNGSPSASSGSALNTYNKGTMGAQLNDRWGNNSLAYGSNATEKARQNACRGTTTCPDNYYYDATSDGAAGRCVPNGVADYAICPNDYTYVSGFDSNSCQRTVTATSWSPGYTEVPWKTCDSYNYTNYYCSGTNSIGYSYSLQPDGSCSGSGGTDCCDDCGRNSTRSARVCLWGLCSGGDCLGGNNCSINPGSRSFAERKVGISCPAGYTSNSENTTNLICRENLPDNVELVGGSYVYKCGDGYTRQANGSCLAKSSPTHYESAQLPN